jgi:hypoxanthine-DNA glycosylase
MQAISFEPIVNGESEILILGTMPGLASLQAQQYYAHPNNIFWDIMFRICIPNWNHFEVVSVDYSIKRDLLLSNKIALWDVLKYCERKGSLDKNIANHIQNEFQDFFDKYPSINRVYFNGKEASKLFEINKGVPSILANRTFTTLPSSSPSNTVNSFYILKEWKQILV